MKTQESVPASSPKIPTHMWEANARSKTIFRPGGIYEIRPTLVPEHPLFREQTGVFWVMMGTRKIHGIQQIMLAACDRSPTLRRVSLELTNNVYGWNFYHPLGQPLALIPAQGVEEDTAAFMGFVTQEDFHNIKALHGPGSDFLKMHDHLAPHFTSAEQKRFRTLIHLGLMMVQELRWQFDCQQLFEG